jgi:hypothetical protein
MRLADPALYAAKHRGRNRVVRADVLQDFIAKRNPSRSPVGRSSEYGGVYQRAGHFEVGTTSSDDVDESKAGAGHLQDRSQQA